MDSVRLRRLGWGCRAQADLGVMQARGEVAVELERVVLEHELVPLGGETKRRERDGLL
jgi:hypothetical protein